MMSSDFVPGGESKYKVTELPNGFTVTGRDRNPVQVVLETTGFGVTFSGDHRCGMGKCGLFQYYTLSLDIAIGLMYYWRPRGWENEEFYPLWWEKWATKQTARAIGKRVHSQWRRLLELADPAVVAVHRSLFAATGGRYNSQSELLANPEFYQDKWLVHDITHYRAAALAAAEIDELLSIKRQYRFWNAKGTVIPFWELTYAEMADLLGHDVILSNNTQVGVVRNPDPNPIEALHNWRGLFSPTDEPYRSLNRTLMNLPGGVPGGLVKYLATITLPRPITDRVELAFTMAYVSVVFPEKETNFGIVLHAKRHQIIEAMRRVNAADHLNLTHRRAVDLISLAQYLADYPDIHRGNLVELADKAIFWHREEREQTTADKAKELGAETLAALPPVALPDIPEVRFLTTVGDICAEGSNMGHCIASYAQGAVQGRCYLFHIEKDGEQASVQVDFMGQVVQAHGPRNRDNKAVAWGRRVLRRWGQGFPEDHEHSFGTMGLK